MKGLPLRAQEIAAAVVTDKDGIWDAYDQGMFAQAAGWSRNMNPHLSYHINHADWNRGWDAEQRRAVVAQRFVDGFDDMRRLSEAVDEFVARFGATKHERVS